MDSYEIKPYSEVAAFSDTPTGRSYDISIVAPVVGMSEGFIRKVIGTRRDIPEDLVIALINQDSFSETFVPRSKILRYLRNH